MRRAHISKNKPNLREEWQYSREKRFRVLLKGNLVSQSLGAPSEGAPRPAPKSHTCRLWYENVYQRDPRGRKNIPTLRSASVSRWVKSGFSYGRSAHVKMPGVAGDSSRGGETLLQFWEVPLGMLSCITTSGGHQRPAACGAESLGKCWPVRLAGVLSGTNSSALLL